MRAVHAALSFLGSPASSRSQVRRVFVPYHASAVSQAIYTRCRVLEATPTNDGMEFVIEGKPHRVEQIVRDSEAAQND